MSASYSQPILAFLAFLSLALVLEPGHAAARSAADEPEHVVKAAAVVRRGASFRAAEDHRDFAGWQHTYTSPDFLEETYRLPHSLVEALAAHDPQCYMFHIDVAADCTVSANQAKELDAQDSATSHMNYFPLYYAAVGWPSLIFSGDAAIYGMRIASAVITALMLAAAFTTSIRRRVGGCARRAGGGDTRSRLLRRRRQSERPRDLLCAARLGFAPLPGPG